MLEAERPNSQLLQSYTKTTTHSGIERAKNIKKSDKNINNRINPARQTLNCMRITDEPLPSYSEATDAPGHSVLEPVYPRRSG